MNAGSEKSHQVIAWIDGFAVADGIELLGPVGLDLFGPLFAVQTARLGSLFSAVLLRLAGRRHAEFGDVDGLAELEESFHVTFDLEHVAPRVVDLKSNRLVPDVGVLAKVDVVERRMDLLPSGPE